MIAKYRRTHKQVQVEKTIARSGGMLKLVPPFLKISLVLTIVKPVDVDVVAVGCFKVFRLFKVAFLDPAGLGDGVESIVVCGEQNCVNLIQDAVRDLKPEEGVLGLSEELHGVVKRGKNTRRYTMLIPRVFGAVAFQRSLRRLAEMMLRCARRNPPAGTI